MTIIEQKFKISVTEDLRVLNGTQFEYFCRGVLQLILSERGDNAEILHKGHNLFAKPVGYTGDFITEEAQLIGQCGTDDNYFSDFEKPLNDIKRAIVNHPQCKEVYLFSNQRSTGGAFTDLQKKITDNGHKLDAIVVLDSERIAETILRNITSTNVVLPLMEDLPLTAQYYKILPQNNRPPNFRSTYYNRDADEGSIKSSLNKNNIVQCYGLSGIGKTELSVAVAKSLQKDYDTIVWLNGDDFSGKVDFNSVKISGLNDRINLEVLLQNYHLLVVVDNLNETVAEFKTDFELFNKKNSACIITSLQLNLDPAYGYQLGYLDNMQACLILHEGTVIPNEDETSQILEHVNGYPLVLRLIKSAVEAQELSWSEFTKELTEITYLQDERNRLISQRIIDKFKSTLNIELGLISFINSRVISIHFLKESLGKIRVNQLIKRGLISQADSDFYTLHQLVLDCIKAEINTTENIPVFDEYVSKYLERYNPKKTADYYIFIFTHAKMVKEIYDRADDNHSKKRLILYALIQKADLNGNIDELKTDIAKLKLNPHNPFDVYLIIEKHEIELTEINNKMNKNDFDQKCEEIIHNLLAVKELHGKDEVAQLLNHHIGKIYAKQNKVEEAKGCFYTVIQNDPKADYARLQLIRIYRREKDYVKAKAEWEKAFLLENDFQNRSLSILLSLYEMLVEDEFSELRAQHLDAQPERFMQFIVRSIDASFEYPYRVLHKMCKHLSYNLTNCYDEICKNLPLPSKTNSKNNEELRKAFAAIQLAYYNMLKFSERTNREEKMLEALHLSEEYWKTTDLTDEFNLKGIIDLYIAVEKFEDALIYTKQQKEGPFKNQLFSKIYRGLKDYDTALTHINAALAKRGIVKAHQAAAFLNDKAEILHQMGNMECITCLEEALSLQKAAKTIESWQGKLASWSSNKIMDSH